MFVKPFEDEKCYFYFQVSPKKKKNTKRKLKKKRPEKGFCCFLQTGVSGLSSCTETLIQQYILTGKLTLRPFPWGMH